MRMHMREKKGTLKPLPRSTPHKAGVEILQRRINHLLEHVCQHGGQAEVFCLLSDLLDCPSPLALCPLPFAPCPLLSCQLFKGGGRVA